MKTEKSKLLSLSLFLLISFLCHFNIAISQNQNMQYKVDTLSFNKTKVIIKVPLNSKKLRQGYEEGTFVNYTILSDSAIINIHYGAMVSIPFLQGSNYIIQNDTSIKKGQYIIRRRKGIVIKSKNLFFKKRGYFREDYIKEHSITITYENVSESQIRIYDYILDNVKIEIK